MGNAPETIEFDRGEAGSRQLNATEIQRALAEILVSVPFRASKQAQQLLRYIVDQTLAGHGELLKERVIGAEVFGRRPDYDTNLDPIVRARAAELRKRLAQFYVGEGARSQLRIEISPGSYHASFSGITKSLLNDLESAANRIHQPALEFVPVVDPVTQISSSSAAAGSGEKPGRLRLPMIAVLVCALAGTSYFSFFRPKSPIDQFWEPILRTTKPVLIYTGSNPVYLPSRELLERYGTTHQLDDLEVRGHEFLIPLDSDQKFGPGDLVAVRNTYVTLGDVSANVAVASFLTQHKRIFDLRSGEDVAFGDFRRSPSVLIGAFNNGWTMQMTGDLDFVFGAGLMIQDRSNPKHSWASAYSSDGKVNTDYAIVARLRHSKTDESLITVAGITQSGTRAAAEFITNPEEIRELIKSAPKAWATENMELILQTKVVSDIPANPTVVAVRYW